MSTALNIRTILAEMPVGQVFTTRDFVNAGTRNAVDKCLQRLVNNGDIRRIANGVFSNGPEPVYIEPMEVARIKAAAFHKEVSEHPHTTAQRLGFTEKQRKGDDLIVATNGTSSSKFRMGKLTIHLKATAARKRHEHRNAVWEVLKALWHVGKKNITSKLIEHIKRLWGQQAQKQLQHYTSWIPHWLLDLFPRNDGLAIESLYQRNVPFAFERQSEAEQEKPSHIALIKQLPPELVVLPCPENDEPTVEEREAEEAACIAFSKGYCACYDGDDDCICDSFTCQYCQTRPITNKFRIFVA